ncbi:MAG: elongation factor G [Dehalococcoidia bacterium]
MDQFSTKQIRNVVLLSHSGAGKTSLIEAMLFASRGTGRIGRVEDGNTVSDFEPEEHHRRTSLQLSVVPCIWKGTKINLIDTPGYADFIGETVSALRAADAAVLVVSAPAGVEVGAEMAWRRIQALNMPVLVYVNKMDREHADFDGALEQVRGRLGSKCAAVNLPIGAEHEFKGVVDLLGSGTPDDMAAVVATAREQLAEAVAEADDGLTEKFLEEGELTIEEMVNGLHEEVRTGRLVPVLCGAATASKGVEQLLDAMVSYLPAPDEMAPVKGMKDGKDVDLTPDAKGPLAALVFKTSADPFVGKLSYFRVCSGTLTANHEVWDSGTSQAERISQVFVPVGKTQESVPALVAGDIGCVSKLAHAVTGDTLTTKVDVIALPRIEFPPSVYSVAIHPKSKQDLDKLSSSLVRLVEEDPSLRLTRDLATGEIIVTGMGDTHVDVMAERAKRKFGVELDITPPRVPYRETIGKVTTVEYKHKKQSGGHGQYGHVFLRLEPVSRGEGFAFASAVVGGSVPKEYVPAVEKGVHKTIEEGALAGYPIVDVKVVLTDGSSHPVDSSGQSFEIAGGMAMKKGMAEAAPTLLEPVMRLHIAVPEHSAGAVVGDLNTRRAHIAGMTPDGGVAHIEALAPQSEAQQYSTTLRALTQGRGEFTMEFDHYSEVPAHLVQKIVDSHHAEPARV